MLVVPEAGAESALESEQASGARYDTILSFLCTPGVVDLEGFVAALEQVLAEEGWIFMVADQPLARSGRRSAAGRWRRGAARRGSAGTDVVSAVRSRGLFVTDLYRREAPSAPAGWRRYVVLKARRESPRRVGPVSRVVLAGGRELDAGTPAGRALTGCSSVAVVTVAAAFRRPDALMSRIGVWAEALSVRPAVVSALRRSDALNPDVSGPIADCDGVLVLDGSPAHFVSAVKATPLLEAIVAARGRGADIVWSGAAAAAVCASMVDDRGGALTVGLGLH